MSSQVLCSATKLLSYAFFSLIQNVETIDSVKKKTKHMDLEVLNWVEEA